MLPDLDDHDDGSGNMLPDLDDHDDGSGNMLPDPSSWSPRGTLGLYRYPLWGQIRHFDYYWKNLPRLRKESIQNKFWILSQLAWVTTTMPPCLYWFLCCVSHHKYREGLKKNRYFLGLSPKLWVGGGQES